MHESFWSGRRVMFAAGFLSSFLLLFALLAVQNYNRHRHISEQHASGVGAVAGGEAATGWDPDSLWRQSRLVDYVLPENGRVAYGVIGGVPGGVMAMQLRVAATKSEARKITRNASLSLGVSDPARAVQQVREIAEQLGGYMTSSHSSVEVNGVARIAVLVPADRLDEALARLKALASSVEAEQVIAQDVTREYADLEAALVNARAEEAQYRELMKRAKTLDEVMSVTQELSRIRTQIDQKEGEFRRMRQQVEMSEVNVELRVESETQVGGFHWRPAYRLKMALHDGIDSIAFWIGAMITLLFQLPVIVLWLVTIVLAAAIGWKILRWVWRRVFVPRSV